MDMAIQILGAVLILAAFAASQFGLLALSSPAYLVFNFVGSGLLGINALDGRQCGFVLLEFVWALVSAIGLVKVLRGDPPQAAAHTSSAVRRSSAQWAASLSSSKSRTIARMTARPLEPVSS
jgi:hypothetical protein